MLNYLEGWMRFLFLVLMALIAGVQCLFAAYGDRKYEGREEFRNGHKKNWTRFDVVAFYLPSDPIVFEAGANNGVDSVKLAEQWPLGKIISFEPIPNQFASYQQRAAAYDNMYGYNLAVGEYNGTAKFYVCWGTGGKDPKYEGASSLLKPSEGMKIHYMGPEIEVPCVVLDDWCRENNVDHIDFMWLDLEGFELQLLKSSPNILKTVKVIFTETNSFRFREGTTLYPMLKSFLKSQGFVMVAHWFMEGIQGNAVFVRQELLDKSLSLN